MEQGVLLCLVNGPWQALSLAASLRELAASARHAKCVALLVDMEEGSSFHGATARILRANGLVELHTIAKSTPLSALAEVVRAIERASSIELADVSSVLTYGVHRPIARYLVSLTGRAKVVIYEEGLRNYVPPSSSIRERARIRLAQTWGRVAPNFGKAWTFPQESARTLEYCLLLGRRLPTPLPLRNATVHHVSDIHLQSAIATAPTSARRTENVGPFVIMVGQYYARLKQMSVEQELEAYAQAARSIVQRGQTPVWRGHIRETDAYFEQLRRRCPELCNFNQLVDDASLPLELHSDLLTNGCAGAVSFSSSALFYLHHLYGLSTQTLLTEQMIHPMNYPHREACLLALQHIPPFKAMEAVA